MSFSLRSLPFLASLALAGFTAQAQTPAPAQPQSTTSAAITPLPEVVAPPTLDEDSIRVMSELVQTSVRRLHSIYFEPNDARATQLIETALTEIPALNQRLSRYTVSLTHEQQKLLAQRLRQQPWQIELQTLMRSPQFKEFDARAAKDPALKAATERLHASGFIGTNKTAAAPAATTASASGVAAEPAKTPAPAAISVAKAAPGKPGTAAKPVAPAAVTVTKPATIGAAKPTAAVASVPKPTSVKAGAAPVAELAAASKKLPAKAVTVPAPKSTVPSRPIVAAKPVAIQPAAPAKATPPAVVTPAPASEATLPLRHTVVKGETLFGICRKYKVTPAQMRLWNHKKDDGVRIGEVLLLSAGQ